ncbi:hypothetical protein [Gemmata sp.]|uniref:hypothetical protein n=1 Tax=Gemmata sp. TaxID=1914242 RepID=UPI003F723EFA
MPDESAERKPDAATRAEASRMLRAYLETFRPTRPKTVPSKTAPAALQPVATPPVASLTVAVAVFKRLLAAATRANRETVAKIEEGSNELH